MSLCKMVGIEIFRALDHWMYYQVLMIGSWGLCPGPLIGGEEAAETRARPMARRPAEVSEVDDGEQCTAVARWAPVCRSQPVRSHMVTMLPVDMSTRHSDTQAGPILCNHDDGSTIRRFERAVNRFLSELK